jgi:hypothetical protein
MHREPLPPTNTSKLVNQQLEGIFELPEASKLRDSMRPDANKRIIRAIVQDNGGDSIVTSARKAFVSPQVDTPTTQEDFQKFRKLHLPRLMRVNNSIGVGVWVTLPDLLKLPKMEYLDLLYLSFLAKQGNKFDREQFLSIALLMGKVSRQHQLALQARRKRKAGQLKK